MYAAELWMPGLDCQSGVHTKRELAVTPSKGYRLLLLLLQAGAIEDDLDSLLHKRLNAGLSTFCIAQALLLVSSCRGCTQQAQLAAAMLCID